MFTLINDLHNKACLCGSNKSYQQCCLKFHDKSQYPITAEALMRSRFSAFDLHLTSYLLDTWYKPTRPGHLDFTPGLVWKKLIIKSCKKGQKKDQEGWVTFMAYYVQHGRPGCLHEKSFFKRDDLGHWVYVDGDIKE